MQKPFMLRRSFATFKKVWPEMDITMTTMDMSWADYCKDSEVRALTCTNHAHMHTQPPT